VSRSSVWDGFHRFEHWYRDNTAYFITARVRGQQKALASEEAKAIFWDRFNHYTKEFGFTPWVTSVLDNHYHDGCLRDEIQARRTYRYVLTQCRRHQICDDPKDYPHTIVNVELERAIKRALELKAFMKGVPYKRYGEG